MIDRRQLILASGSALLLSGCDRLNGNPAFRQVLRSAEGLTMRAQRLVTDRTALAREYSEADMSPIFRSNGTRLPDTPDYARHLAERFTNYRLRVDGLVTKPLSLSLEQIRALPVRTQVTRHDCVEGWSAIGKWHGVPLGLLLKGAGLSSRARFVVFHCMDRLGGRPYYESIDLVDAFHPQTILAWGMNNRALEVPHGAPLRLRVERQLGYKHAKFVERIEAVESLAGIHGGRGGYWEDSGDYEWYAGI
ncbi:molybdopterin-dependent oxidoreductase [Sphingomonas sp. BN140010]|uniref:Molybdopterin-dependent oxidoreductase n=1 Tax=Sphingomonas arvum TaxID=2992113 RepID=A0ABT3JC99_9SPHN|nr:molybdopterin-dependent oxidoreductase [Sphingomonas sp. BN140010]MCW3796693.1 molybdopterin-dependent oxidoreductase [Sphingomonas sp. BN140010]